MLSILVNILECLLIVVLEGSVSVSVSVCVCKSVVFK